MERAFDLVMEKLEGWLDTLIAMLPNLAVAIFVIVIFGFLSGFVQKGVRRALGRTTSNKAIVNLLATIAKLAVLALGIFIALSILELDRALTSLLAGAGIIGLALGFAFQDMAANFMSGISMSIRRPFKIGDLVTTNDHMGTVEEINLRSSQLRLPDGQLAIIPNKDVFQNTIINYSEPGQRRVDIECGVSYGEDLEQVKELTIEALTGIEGMKEDRGIEFAYTEFGGSSINFKALLWIDDIGQKNHRQTRSEAIMRIKSAFDEHDISIPFPIRTLDFGIRGGDSLADMLGEADLSTADQGNDTDSSGRDRPSDSDRQESQRDERS